MSLEELIKKVLESVKAAGDAVTKLWKQLQTSQEPQKGVATPPPEPTPEERVKRAAGNLRGVATPPKEPTVEERAKRKFQEHPGVEKVVNTEEDERPGPRR